MFIPIGGVFIIGNGPSAGARVASGFFDLLLGGIFLALGYVFNLLFLVIIGYIIAGLGIIMILMNIFSLGREKEYVVLTNSDSNDTMKNG